MPAGTFFIHEAALTHQGLANNMGENRYFLRSARSQPNTVTPKLVVRIEVMTSRIFACLVLFSQCPLCESITIFYRSSHGTLEIFFAADAGSPLWPCTPVL